MKSETETGDNLGKWSSQMKNTITTKLEGVKDRDLRFFRIEEFIRNLERTEEYAADCSECAGNKTEIGWSIEKIDEAVNIPGPERREFDRLISRISRHLMKEHGFYAPFHYTYLYSFYGMVAGSVVGYIGMKIFPSLEWIPLIIGFATGLIVARIVGAKKDRQVRKAKKIM